MLSCPRCEGFIPQDTAACPNCGEQRSPSSPLWLGRLGKMALGGAVAMTLMACYGGPRTMYGPPPPPPQPEPNCANANAATNEENATRPCAPPPNGAPGKPAQIATDPAETPPQ
jgi:hypothetical protein